jgi:hypothetical protein
MRSMAVAPSRPRRAEISAGLKAERNREGLGVLRVAFYIWRRGSIEGRGLGIERGESWRGVLVIVSAAGGSSTVVERCEEREDCISQLGGGIHSEREKYYINTTSLQ